MMYVSQIIGLYTLNIYGAICQLYLSKTGRKDTPPRTSTARYRYGMKPPGGKWTPSVPVWAAGFLDCDRSPQHLDCPLGPAKQRPGLLLYQKKFQKAHFPSETPCPLTASAQRGFQHCSALWEGVPLGDRYFWAGQWAKKQKQSSFPKNVWIKYPME